MHNRKWVQKSSNDSYELVLGSAHQSIPGVKNHQPQQEYQVQLANPWALREVTWFTENSYFDMFDIYELYYFYPD